MKSTKKSLIVWLMIGVPSMVLSQTLPSSARVEKNQVYGMYSGLALLMDIHYPAKPNGYGIVFIAGSGWHAPMSYDAWQLKELSQTTLIYQAIGRSRLYHIPNQPSSRPSVSLSRCRRRCAASCPVHSPSC